MIRLLVEVGIYSIISAALVVLGVALTMFAFIIHRISERYQLEKENMRDPMKDQAEHNPDEYDCLDADCDEGFDDCKN